MGSVGEVQPTLDYLNELGQVFGWPEIVVQVVTTPCRAAKASRK
jgi:hypothetical protein